MTTREQSIRAAGFALAEGRALRDSLPVADAARLAYTPTGPSITELEQLIAAQRGTQTPAPAVATPVPRQERATKTSERRSA